MRSDEILFSPRTALDGRKRTHQFRQRRIVEPLDATHVQIDGKPYVNFASNNYLALTHHPRLIAAAAHATAQYGTGAAAAGLITGYTPAHAAAEQAIATWKGTERAILLPSGYQANQAAVQSIAAVAAALPVGWAPPTSSPPPLSPSPGTPGEGRGEGSAPPALEPRGPDSPVRSPLGSRGVRFLMDKLAHASLIDAVRSTGQPFRVFPHNNLSKLSRLLADADESELQVVVTESIFSMDGDAAPLADLAALKQQHPFLLLLDEAHGSGVYGPAGSGLAAEQGLPHLADLTTVTLSKALGSVGGAVCCSADWAGAIVNFGRASIYTTNLPPSVAAVATAAIDVLQTEPQHQQRVRSLAKHVRAELTRLGLSLPPGDSPILPVILGDETRTLAAADFLRDQGLLTIAVRPPTVPPNTSRLRLTLSSAHTDDEVARLIAALSRLPTR